LKFIFVKFRFKVNLNADQLAVGGCLEGAMDGTVTVPVKLSNGRLLNVQSSSALALDPEELVTGRTLPPADLKEILAVVEGLSRDLGEAFERIAPDKASVEFGIEIAAEPGKVLALLVQGSGKANLKIVLEWDRASAAPSKTAA
jgi:hypothetical protein